MRSDEARLTELAAAVLDGTPVDWAAIESGPAGARLPFLEHLKLVAAVAEVHRNAVSDTDRALGLSPTHWGHLQLLERIGEGAFGDVYRAWDTRLDREVALKLLPADPTANPRTASSIIQEGRLLARVRHPNVVTIYGAERIDGRVGLWMELVKGRTLEQLIQQGKVFSAIEAASIGSELCRAVRAVHDAGLLHRDIKATNVMLADDGRVVLMDFGTGRDVAEDPDATLAGTPLYLAPELFAGNNRAFEATSIALACCSITCSRASYPVLAGSRSELRRAHDRGERRSLRAVRQDVPQRLARAIDRATDSQPARRPASAAELAASLIAPRSGVRVNRWWTGLAAGGAAATAIALSVGRGGPFSQPRGVMSRHSREAWACPRSSSRSDSRIPAMRSAQGSPQTAGSSSTSSTRPEARVCGRGSLRRNEITRLSLPLKCCTGSRRFRQTVSRCSSSAREETTRDSRFTGCR